MRWTKGLVAATVAACVASTLPGAARAASPTTSTPIQHFVAVLQEKHSFDNYFGTYEGADGIPAGVCMLAPALDDRSEAPCVKPFEIGDRPSQNLLDDQRAFLGQAAFGSMKGFVLAQSQRGVTKDIVMGHYTRDDLAYYHAVADNYVLFDRWFASANGGTLWNHNFWVTGTPGNPLAERVPEGGYGDLPTIFDRLQAKGVSWKFYVQNYDKTETFRSGSPAPIQVVRNPLLAFARFVDDPELSKHIVPVDEYFDDLHNGTLPAVSYIVPDGASERPPGRIQSGEAFVRSLVMSLKRSTAWGTSAFMLSYANWGGWYDHVLPPSVDRFGLGFRVPALLISPYVGKGVIDHTQYDHTSMLKFIESNWDVEPLSTRDAAANDLAKAFDFKQSPRPPELTVELNNAAPKELPTRGIIYPAYLSMLLLGSALFVLAFRHNRTSRAAALP